MILLFVESEILKFFLHKSNKRVKFFMADTSHRTFCSLEVSLKSSTNECIFSRCSKFLQKKRHIQTHETIVCYN